MPIASRYPIEELMSAVRAYVEQTGRRVVFEYALIDRLNSDPAHGLSQVFIALDYRKIAPEAQSDAILRETLAYVQGSTVAPRASEVRWPGSRLAETRERNLQNGIPVDERVWASILALQK